MKDLAANRISKIYTIPIWLGISREEFDAKIKWGTCIVCGEPAYGMCMSLCTKHRAEYNKAEKKFYGAQKATEKPQRIYEETQLYRALIHQKGISNQLIKTAEEATELAKAALKLLQSQDPVEFSQRRRDLAEEIADTQLLAEQLIDHYQLSDLIVYYRTLKLRKIKQLIGGEETEQ